MVGLPYKARKLDLIDVDHVCAQLLGAAGAISGVTGGHRPSCWFWIFVVVRLLGAALESRLVWLLARAS
jgi:hypothetical protein